MSRRHTVRLVTAGAAVVVLLVGVAAAAEASFTRSRSTSLTVSVATLQPPTNVSASNTNCNVLGSTSVRVSWTASSSTFVGGYEIHRATSSNGSYTLVGTVTGTPPATTFLNQSVGHSTTYWYKVRSTKTAWNWTSAETTPVSIRTPSTLCVL